MNPHSENSRPLLPRNVYTQAILKELNAAPYDPERHSGMRNPYSHKIVACEADYNEYVREYVYYRLCDEFLNQRYNVQLSAHIQQLDAEQQNSVDQFKRKYDDSASMIGRLLVIVSVVLAFLLAYVVFWHVPAKESARYDAGYSSGYRHGYVRGYADALLDDSKSSSRDSTVGVTIPKAGIGFNQTVYISRNDKIHLNRNCSGMKDYFIMEYGAACTAGYSHCRICF